jgi:hypothetical protein
MKMIGPWKPVVVLVVGSAVLVGAYGAYQEYTVGGYTVGAQTPTPGVWHTSTSKLTLHIVAPANRARLTVPFTVKLASDVPLGAPETSRHHAHLYYDTTTPTGSYGLVYGKTFKVTDLRPGKHTILASLRNADHSDAGPRQLITVTIVRGTTKHKGATKGRGARRPSATPTPYASYRYGGGD